MAGEVFELPDTGLRRDGALRIGRAWGGFQLELLDADRAAVSIAGATLFGVAWKRDTPGTTFPITVQFKPDSDTTIQYWMTDAQSAAIGSAPNYFDGPKTHAYHVGYSLPAGQSKVVVFGVLDTLSGVPA